MFRKPLLLLFLSTTALYSQEFPLGVWFSGDQSALDSVSALNFTWVQAYCGWNSDDAANYRYILKNKNGLKVIALIENSLHNPSFSQRLFYEAEQPVDSTGTKNYFARLSQTAGAASGEYWEARVGRDGPGFIAKDPFPHDLFLYGRREWAASFHMKIDPTGNFETPVVRFEVAQRERVFAQKEVLEKEFEGTTPRTLEFRFTLPADYQPSTLDVRVWWHGRANAYLDYMVCEDFVADPKHSQFSGGYQLFRGDRDAEIIAAAKHFASAEEYPLLQRFYLKDEPYHNGHETFRYVDQLILKHAKLEGAAQGRGRTLTATPNYTQNTPARETSFERVLRDAQPHELFVDAYPVHADIPADTVFMPAASAQAAGVAPFFSYADFNAKLQSTFDYMIDNSLLPAVRVTQRHGAAWWYIAQAHGELCAATGRYRRGDNDKAMLRTPAPEELRAMIYLALAYGAKGIFYFAYPTFSDPDFGGCKPAHFPGLIAFAGKGRRSQSAEARSQHASDYDLFAGRTVFTGYRQKYEAVRTLNAELKKLGPLLLELEWRGGLSVHRLRGRPLAQTFGLHGVTAATLQGKRDAQTETYVEIGLFKKAEAHYYLVVNRRGGRHEIRRLTLDFQTAEAAPRVLTDFMSGAQVRFETKKFSYRVILKPGEGALLRLMHQ